MTIKSISKYVLIWVLMLSPLFLTAQNKIIKVACIGNSVTYGYGIENREQECYPAKLQLLLGDRYQVVNFGHSGATLLKKGHNPYYKTPEFAKAVTFVPDIAIIHLGLNDTDPRDWPDHREDFEADYAWLIAAFRKVNSAVKIYICQLTPIFSGHPRFKSGTRDWYWQIQQLIPVIAKANNTGLIDLHEPLYHRPDLFADNLHPDKEGASILAKTIYQSLTKDFGGFKLSPEFASHMVLQRQQPISVYGTANAGEVITVNFHHQTLKSIADDKGNWKIVFPAMTAGGPFEMTITHKDDAVRLNDILIGDVWLCSGQSNMAFPLNRSAGGKEEIQHAASNKLLRLYRFNVLAETDAVAWDTTTLNKINRLNYFSGTWKSTDSTSIAGFSAVAYYFGKRIAAETHVPIGLIEVAVGGSPIESWIERYTMEHDPVLVDILNNWRKSDYEMKFCRDRADTNLQKAVNTKQRHPYEPCYNYEAGIVRLVNFPVKGVIWYQGESNAHNLELYQHLFPVMVNSWRQQWHSDLPFYYVQLSAIDRPSWPAFRNVERQLQNQIPNTHMAVSMDVGDSLNVHYTRKKPVGDRLALLALHYTYKQMVVADGPQPLYAQQTNNLITITFPAATRLKINGNKSLTGFELVNNKGERLPAGAGIFNSTIRLIVPSGEEIKMIYYAMQPYTRANLINTDGLPASTFIMVKKGDKFY